MQSRNFRLQKVGDINWLEKNYQLQRISFSLDELIILDASKDKNINEFAKIVSRLTDNIFIPIAAGGGVRNMQDAEILFSNGADKIVLNSALINDNLLVQNITKKYGAQSIVASIDYKRKENVIEIFIADGSKKIDYNLVEYLDYINGLDVGEIYLNSIDQDGTGFGYDFETILSVQDYIYTPLIIAGGAGNAKHLLQGLQIDKVNAVATANLFNFVNDGFPKARKELLNNQINLPAWHEDAL